MKFQFDHDYHIHSQLSACSRNPEQNNERILQYAKDNGLKRIVLTDHYWDEAVPDASGWYRAQGFAHISQALPLPQAEGIEFLFGCETELNKDLTLGIPPERYDDFALILVPTTHTHMVGFTISAEDRNDPKAKAAQWVKRLDAVLNMKLPFEKVGIVHPLCESLDIIGLVSNEDMERLFTKAAQLGCGIELNQDDVVLFDSAADSYLRPFRIAKACGCKFFLGSDAHSPARWQYIRGVFERAIDLLDLSENDKFYF